VPALPGRSLRCGQKTDAAVLLTCCVHQLGFVASSCEGTVSPSAVRRMSSSARAVARSCTEMQATATCAARPESHHAAGACTDARADARAVSDACCAAAVPLLTRSPAAQAAKAAALRGAIGFMRVRCKITGGISVEAWRDDEGSPLGRAGAAGLRSIFCGLRRGAPAWCVQHEVRTRRCAPACASQPS